MEIYVTFHVTHLEFCKGNSEVIPVSNN